MQASVPRIVMCELRVWGFVSSIYTAEHSDVLRREPVFSGQFFFSIVFLCLSFAGVFFPLTLLFPVGPLRTLYVPYIYMYIHTTPHTVHNLHRSCRAEQSICISGVVKIRRVQGTTLVTPLCLKIKKNPPFLSNQLWYMSLPVFRLVRFLWFSYANQNYYFRIAGIGVLFKNGFHELTIYLSPKIRVVFCFIFKSLDLEFDQSVVFDDSEHF